MTTNTSEARPVPGRPAPAVLSGKVVNIMARKGRVPLAVVAGLNILRRDPKFAATIIAKDDKVA